VINPKVVKETEEPILTDDEIDEFIAECKRVQTKVRALEAMAEAWKEGELDSMPGYSRTLFGCRLQLGILYEQVGGRYFELDTDFDTSLATDRAACWLTAANLVRGCYTGGAWD
jgi:hypothetical protein